MSDINATESGSPERTKTGVTSESTTSSTPRERPSYGHSAERHGDYDEGSGQRRETRGRMQRQGRPFYRKKYCKFCANNKGKGPVIIDYKKVDVLRRCTTERGKILPRRITGNCAKCQRKLAIAVKRARALALLPFSA